MSRGIAQSIIKSGRCRRTRKNGANLSESRRSVRILVLLRRMNKPEAHLRTSMRDGKRQTINLKTKNSIHIHYIPRLQGNATTRLISGTLQRSLLSLKKVIHPPLQADFFVSAVRFRVRKRLNSIINDCAQRVI